MFLICLPMNILSLSSNNVRYPGTVNAVANINKVYEFLLYSCIEYNVSVFVNCHLEVTIYF